MFGRKLKLWAGAGALALVLVGCSSADTDAEVSKSPEAVATTKAAPTAEAKPAASKDGEALAAKVEKAWLTEMGVEKPAELLEVLPDSLAGYVTKFEGVASDTVEITVQVTSKDTSKAELKRMATSVLSTAGFTVEELERVEVVTADRLARGVENRRNVPLLNQ